MAVHLWLPSDTFKTDNLQKDVALHSAERKTTLRESEEVILHAAGLPAID